MFDGLVLAIFFGGCTVGEKDNVRLQYQAALEPTVEAGVRPRSIFAKRERNFGKFLVGTIRALRLMPAFN